MGARTRDLFDHHGIKEGQRIAFQGPVLLDHDGSWIEVHPTHIWFLPRGFWGNIFAAYNSVKMARARHVDALSLGLSTYPQGDERSAS
jgi:hypothetical protein